MLRPKLGRIWSSANTATRRDPGDAKYVTGWLAEIPTFQVLNYLQWTNDTTMQALAERGVFEWGGDIAYRKGSAVWDETNGSIYVSLLNNPSTTLKPSSNAAQWAPSAIQISRKSYDDIVAAMNTHIADVTTNPHKLTTVMLGTYNTTQIDALVAQYRAEVAAHANNTNNPHKLTAAIIGAVPITGGTYTGNVTMATGQVLLNASGTQVVRADANRVYLKNAAGAMGVDANGKGFVQLTGGNPSEIITAATFAANKQLTEPNYATPAPIFYMPLIRDINIYTGGGLSADTFTADIQYDSSGRYLMNQVQGTPGVGGLTVTPSPLAADVETTVAMDITFNNTNAGSNTEAYSIGFGTQAPARNRIYPKSSGVIVGRSGAVLIGTNIGDGKPHRVVQRVTATSASLFIDGLLVASDMTTAQSPIGTSNNIVGKSASAIAADLVSMSVCNLRAWDVALTDSQISNL